ncbi:MAG: metallophosphoesterase [Nanoarchaeota archaeon]|nr:metallophosphoesterase [Nanoarchaeota archaeon]
MKIFDDIELVDLAIYTNKTLIVTDFHIGYEEALNKQGLMIPRFQFQEIMTRLGSIFNKLKNYKIERIIVNGDLKHEFGTISDQEWRHTLKLLDFFSQHCKEIILIKGNHDTILGPIAKKRNVKVLEHYLINTINKNSINNKIQLKNKDSIKKISIHNKLQLKINNKILNKIKIIKNNKKLLKNKILVLHGDEIPNKELLKDVSTIIIGHEHPAVSIKEGPRAELFKAFLVGKWKKYNLIAQPSFNLVVEGTDVLKEKVLSPFLKNNLRNLNAVVVGDKLYGFGKVREL